MLGLIAAVLVGVSPPKAVPAAPRQTKPDVTVYFFTMRTCTPCARYWPAFEAFAERNQLKATFVKVDTQDPQARDLVKKYQIQEVPRVVVTDGEYYTKFNGAPTDDQLSKGIADPSGGLRKTRTLPKAD